MPGGGTAPLWMPGGLVLFLTLFTFTQCLSSQDVKKTVSQTDEHVFEALEVD